MNYAHITVLLARYLLTEMKDIMRKAHRHRTVNKDISQCGRSIISIVIFHYKK
jgi:uncharacterized protein with GYD domain